MAITHAQYDELLKKLIEGKTDRVVIGHISDDTTDKDKRYPLGYFSGEPKEKKVQKAKRAKTPKEAKPKREHSPNNFPVDLLPTPEQMKQLDSIGNAVRHAYNKALELSKAHHALTKAQDGQGQFVQTRGELYNHVIMIPECSAAPSEAVQSVCGEVLRKIKVYCGTRHGDGRVPFPAPRKWEPTGRYFTVNRVILDEAKQRLKIPKIGWISYSPVSVLPERSVRRGIVQQKTVNSWAIILKT